MKLRPDMSLRFALSAVAARVEQLVRRHLAAEERERLAEAVAISAYTSKGLPPRRKLSA